MSRLATQVVAILVVAQLGACAEAPPRKTVLRDIDLPSKQRTDSAATATPKGKDAVRSAYMEYLRHAAKDDKLRVDALLRLAQIEFELNESRGKEAEGASAAARDAAADAATDRTIELLRTLLRDHPKAADNDKALYQLARAYDQRGMDEQSIDALSQLVSRYPASPPRLESQFRIAEHRFIRGDYVRAEDLYTQILVARHNGLFREKALHKRGWARFKQGFYQEAVDDFIAAANLNDFDALATLSEAKKNDFDEYFRAIGLAFIYLGGPESMSEYFANNPGFKYVNHAYARTSTLYLAQDRYADAVHTLAEFNKQYPKSPHVPANALKVVEIWNASGFNNNFVQALDDFYRRFNPQSGYWRSPDIELGSAKAMAAALKDYIVLASAHFHREYRTANKAADFAQAKLWYDRYFAHYEGYARKDNAHYLYAELLFAHNDRAQALAYYERAAYDGNLVANKDAAYATIVTAADLYKAAGDAGARAAYRAKLIDYSLLYAQSYRGDARAVVVSARAAEEAYRAGLYAQAINIAELFANAPDSAQTLPLNTVKAHAYFKSARYPEAEAAYQALLQHPQIDAKARAGAQENLALAIYNQATAAKVQQRVDDAIGHYVRIVDVAPAAETAATGLYDAIVLTYEHKRWLDAVKYIERFQRTYPHHKLNHDASLKLSVAYLNTNQEAAAASQLIKLSRSDETPEYKMAALWKAAGLYEAKQDRPAAIKAYEEYALTYKRPYPQYIEATYKLAELNAAVGDNVRANKWRQQALDADKSTPATIRTDRTNYICSAAALALARREQQAFMAIPLSLPLKRSLAHKRNALQKTLNLFALATSYGVRETVTEATHSIGDVYFAFSRSLLSSERPRGLSAIEQEQYKVLLEDQAFPFEDNAIKFYEKNVLHTKQGVFDDWVRNSYAQLKALFPARYNRAVMVEPYINVIH